MIRFIPDAELYLNGPVTIRSADGQLMVDHDPAAFGTGPSAFVRVFNRRVVRSELAGDGTLTVEFEDDYTLVTPPHDDYEAWEYWHTDGSSVYARVGGGEPTIFGPRDGPPGPDV